LQGWASATLVPGSENGADGTTSGRVRNRGGRRRQDKI
jgi:hypothetical protein